MSSAEIEPCQGMVVDTWQPPCWKMAFFTLIAKKTEVFVIFLMALKTKNWRIMEGVQIH